MRDVDADAKWHALVPRSATWGAQQEEIPEQDRKRLALELLRQGGFRCDRTEERPHCALPLEIDQPRPDEGLDAPCFRRVLASWALVQLDGNDLGALSGIARSIMSLPAPEAELKLEVLEMFSESAPDQLLLLLTEAARIPAQGTVEIYHHIDAVRHTRSDTSRVVHRNHTYVWEIKDLQMALSDCTTTHCAGGDHVVDLTFAPAFDGGLELTRIERTEYVNACGPSVHEFTD